MKNYFDMKLFIRVDEEQYVYVSLVRENNVV